MCRLIVNRRAFIHCRPRREKERQGRTKRQPEAYFCCWHPVFSFAKIKKVKTINNGLIVSLYFSSKLREHRSCFCQPWGLVEKNSVKLIKESFPDGAPQTVMFCTQANKIRVSECVPCVCVCVWMRWAKLSQVWKAKNNQNGFPPKTGVLLAGQLYFISIQYLINQKLLAK